MKKVAALIIIMVFVASSLPVFAQSTMSREEYRKKSLFDKIVDPIKDFKLSEKDKIKPLTMEKAPVFQDSADAIKKIDTK